MDIIMFYYTNQIRFVLFVKILLLLRYLCSSQRLKSTVIALMRHKRHVRALPHYRPPSRLPQPHAQLFDMCQPCVCSFGSVLSSAEHIFRTIVLIKLCVFEFAESAEHAGTVHQTARFDDGCRFAGGRADGVWELVRLARTRFIDANSSAHECTNTHT